MPPAEAISYQSSYKEEADVQPISSQLRMSPYQSDLPVNPYDLESMTRPSSSSSTQSRPARRGPRCPRHALSDSTACSCLVEPAHEELASTSQSQRSSIETSSSLTAAYPHSPIRLKSVSNALTVLPRKCWPLYNDLIDNETAHVQLARELSNMRLSQGCELAPGSRHTRRDESEETFASGVLRQIRTAVNNFYFSEGSAKPVPSYDSEAPTEITTRNVVMFFEKMDKHDAGEEGRTSQRICAWATMWREHVHGMMAEGGKVEACPPVPVVEVRASGTFYLTLIVDTGSEAFGLKETITIGDTNSMEGLCRLRNASVYLSDWRRNIYMPWIKKVTQRAQEARQSKVQES